MAADLVDAYCSGCRRDRSNDPTTRTPCSVCGVSALTFNRTSTASLSVVTDSVSYTLTPGEQGRGWRSRWRTLTADLSTIEKDRPDSPETSKIELGERDLLDFYVRAYHLKDALIADGVVPSAELEAAITATPELALPADLANLDKHGRLNRPPRSGHVPRVVSRSGSSASHGWRLDVAIEHAGRRLDGVTVARQAIDAFARWLTSRGLI